MYYRYCLNTHTQTHFKDALMLQDSRCEINILGGLCHSVIFHHFPFLSGFSGVKMGLFIGNALTWKIWLSGFWRCFLSDDSAALSVILQNLPFIPHPATISLDILTVTIGKKISASPLHHSDSFDPSKAIRTGVLQVSPQPTENINILLALYLKELERGRLEAFKCAYGYIIQTSIAY